MTKKQKREQKLKYWEENIELVRKMRREKRRAARERKRQKKLKKELDEEGIDLEKSHKNRYRNPKSKKFRQELREKIATTAHPIVIDCSFSKHHSDKDEKSLVRQLSQILGSNRKFDNPLKILLTGVSDNFREILKKRNAESWLLGGIHSESYLDMEIMGMKGEELKKNIVYLTGDTEDEMEGFEEG